MRKPFLSNQNNMSDIEEFLNQHEQLFDFTEQTKLIKNFIKIQKNKKIVIVTSGGTSGLEKKIKKSST
jgi:hypothetical protein